MNISLLLSHVSNEQIQSATDVAFYGWLHGPASGGGDEGEDELIKFTLPKYSIRKEAWGGILVYGPTQSVYQFDTDALPFMERLASGESLESLANAEISALLQKLKIT